MFSYLHYEKKYVSFMIIMYYQEKRGLFPRKNRLKSAKLLLLYSCLFFSTTTATLTRRTISASGPTYLYTPVPFIQNRKDFQP